MGDGMIFTVLTSTHNRCDTLERAFDSLRAQDFPAFEWLVVDDGSQDSTGALIERLRAQSPFPVRYLHQENLGKHVAWNRGAVAAHGELIVNLDSDDALAPGALSRLWSLWNDIPESDRSSFVGVTGLCVGTDGQVMGDRFPRSPFDSDLATVGLKLNIKGDKAGFVRREVVLEHPFPEPSHTKFMPEGRTGIEIARFFKTRFVNDVILVIHADGGARLSALGRLNRAYGDLEYNRYALNQYGDELTGHPFTIAKLAALVVRAGLLLGLRPSEIVRSMQGGRSRIAATLMLPLGAALYVRDMTRALGELGPLIAISRGLPRLRLARRAANAIRRFYVRKERPVIEVPVLDFIMALEPNECVDGWALFYPQLFDWREIDFLVKSTPPDGVFVDVGANIGFYSLRLSRHLRSGKILAIEADPYNAKKLGRNVSLSNARNVMVFEGGVADREMTLSLNINTTGNRGGNSFAVDGRSDSVMVPCRPLGEIVAQYGLSHIDSMKLDIEGFEFPVLRAFFEETPRKLWPRAMVIEVEPSLAIASSGDVLGLLCDRGYRECGRADANVMLVLES